MTQLKTHLYETQKARVLVVGGLPEDAEDISIIHAGTRVAYFRPHYKRFDIPQGNWQLLGKLHEITEDQWKGIVDHDTYPMSDDIIGYQKYGYNGLDYLSDTATESGLSLIESEVCLKNPHGEQPKLSSYSQGDMFSFEDNESNAAAFACDFSEWQAAEDQVYHNPVIFWEKK